MAPKNSQKRKQADSHSSKSSPEAFPNKSSKVQRNSHSASASNDESSQAVTDQNSTSPIYFWREYGTEHCYLSQWYSSPFSTDDDAGIEYSSAEQYMMYQKALLFHDTTIANAIIESTSPLEMKALGRKVTPFDNDTWLANRERIVEEASYYKFKNGVAAAKEGNEREQTWKVRDLRKALDDTGDRELVEASPRDRIWGVGFGAERAGSMRAKWGLNLLGKALMAARKRLREEAAEEVKKAHEAKGEETEEKMKKKAEGGGSY